MPQVVPDQLEAPLPWMMVNPDPQANWPATPTPVAVALCVGWAAGMPS